MLVIVGIDLVPFYTSLYVKSNSEIKNSILGFNFMSSSFCVNSMIIFSAIESLESKESIESILIIKSIESNTIPWLHEDVIVGQ